MEVRIQKLENVVNEVGESVKERDDRISKLQAQIRIRTETSELTQLQAKLNEVDKCLRTALTEKQSLQVWAKYFTLLFLLWLKTQSMLDKSCRWNIALHISNHYICSVSHS